jgi:hypothetical protein
MPVTKLPVNEEARSIDYLFEKRKKYLQKNLQDSGRLAKEKGYPI